MSDICRRNTSSLCHRYWVKYVIDSNRWVIWYTHANTYTHKHTRTHTHKHTHSHTWVTWHMSLMHILRRRNMCVCHFVCVHIIMCVCRYVLNRHMFIHIYTMHGVSCAMISASIFVVSLSSGTYIHKYVHTHTCTCMWIYIWICTYKYTFQCIYKDIHTFTNVYTFNYASQYMPIHIYVYIHISRMYTSLICKEPLSPRETSQSVFPPMWDATCWLPRIALRPLCSAPATSENHNTAALLEKQKTAETGGKKLRRKERIHEVCK